jgi:hypothetical protein
VTSATIALESRLIARLFEQHIIDSIDFAICNVMVMHEPAEIVNMVPALQLAIGNYHKPTGELGGMTMTFKTTVIPHPMKINAGVSSTAAIYKIHDLRLARILCPFAIDFDSIDNLSG